MSQLEQRIRSNQLSIDSDRRKAVLYRRLGQTLAVITVILLVTGLINSLAWLPEQLRLRPNPNPLLDFTGRAFGLVAAVIWNAIDSVSSWLQGSIAETFRIGIPSLWRSLVRISPDFDFSGLLLRANSLPPHLVILPFLNGLVFYAAAGWLSRGLIDRSKRLVLRSEKTQENLEKAELLFDQVSAFDEVLKARLGNGSGDVVIAGDKNKVIVNQIQQLLRNPDPKADKKGWLALPAVLALLAFLNNFFSNVASAWVVEWFK